MCRATETRAQGEALRGWDLVGQDREPSLSRLAWAASGPPSPARLCVIVAHSRRAASKPAQEPRSEPAAVIVAAGEYLVKPLFPAATNGWARNWDNERRITGHKRPPIAHRDEPIHAGERSRALQM
eukprot:COSAG01_NODE_971_length_12373_cov_114.625957_4_plen_126_part_00